MIKFISEDEVTGTKIEYSIDGMYLPHVIEHFELFIKAVGFNFDGHLDVVEEEENEQA